MNELLALVYIDICGSMITQVRGGYSYFITFTDDLSRFGYVYLMKHKFEAFDKFEYQCMSRNKLKKILKFFNPTEEVNTFSVDF